MSVHKRCTNSDILQVTVQQCRNTLLNLSNIQEYAYYQEIKAVDEDTLFKSFT